ncbi:MAG: PQQ-binding-like beta-propeller repeat protein [Gemmatimonadota bacterium]|nr:MAG: PQQ-binding-like beta-propeller repeat protein [Gemmatimonadota bacterium]
MRRSRQSYLVTVVVLAAAAFAWTMGCGDPAGTRPEITGVNLGKGDKDVTVTATDPSEAEQGTTLDVEVYGSGFVDGSVVEFGHEWVPHPKIKTNSTRYANPRKLIANITIESDAPVEWYDVMVSTPRGKKGMGTEMFQVRARNQCGVSSDPSSRVAWTFKTQDGVFSAPAFANGTIYFGSADEFFYAVTTEGCLKWKFRTDGRVHKPAAVSADGSAVFVIGLRTLYALDAAAGDLIWDLYFGRRKGKNRGPILYGVALGNGLLYLGTGDGDVHAVDPNDGSVVYSASVGSGHNAYSAPTIGPDGTVYMTSAGPNYPDGFIHAFTPDLSNERWRVGPLHFTEAAPIHDGVGTLYVPSREAYLHALDATTGVEQWRVEIDDPDETQLNAAPALGPDGTIYVPSYAACPGGSDPSQGCLYAADPNGNVKWTVTIGEGVWNASPAVGADGTIYLGGLDYNVYAVSSTGQVLWTYLTGWWVASPPTLDPTVPVVYIGSDDGNLYALRTFATTPGLAASPWPKYRHDLRNTGRHGP